MKTRGKQLWMLSLGRKKHASMNLIVSVCKRQNTRELFLVIEIDLLSFHTCQMKYLRSSFFSSFFTKILFIGIFLNHAWRPRLKTNEYVKVRTEYSMRAFFSLLCPPPFLKLLEKWCSIVEVFSFLLPSGAKRKEKCGKSEGKRKIWKQKSNELVRPGGKKVVKFHSWSLSLIQLFACFNFVFFLLLHLRVPLRLELNSKIGINLFRLKLFHFYLKNKKNFCL